MKTKKKIIKNLQSTLITFDHEKYPQVLKCINDVIELYKNGETDIEKFKHVAYASVDAAYAAYAASSAAYAAGVAADDAADAAYAALAAVCC